MNDQIERQAQEARQAAQDAGIDPEAEAFAAEMHDDEQDADDGDEE